VEQFPQIAGANPSWNYYTYKNESFDYESKPSFDVNRDFNPDLKSHTRFPFNLYLIQERLQDKSMPNMQKTIIMIFPDQNLPGTALGAFALNGSGTVLFKVRGQTQSFGQKEKGMLIKAVERGLYGKIDGVTDGSKYIKSIRNNTSQFHCRRAGNNKN
jgi:hypothetical protein